MYIVSDITSPSAGSVCQCAILTVRFLALWIRPLLLLSSLLIDLLFVVIGKIGNHMAGWDTIDQDMEDMHLAAVEAKKATRRRRLENTRKPKTRPRKMLLLFSNIALLLLSLVDGLVAALFSTVAARSAGWGAMTAESFPVLGAVVAYGWYSMKIQQMSADAISPSILLKVASSISLVLTLSILACMLAFAIMRKSRISSVLIMPSRAHNSVVNLG